MKSGNDLNLIAIVLHSPVNTFLVLLIYASTFLSGTEEDLSPGVVLSKILDSSIADIIILAGNRSDIITGILDIHGEILNRYRNSSIVGHLYKLSALLFTLEMKGVVKLLAGGNYRLLS